MMKPSITDRYRELENSLFGAANKAFSKIHPLLAGLIIWMVSTLALPPTLSRWNWMELSRLRTSDFLILCDNPLARNLTEPIMAYRITVPLIAWALHLPDWGALLLPFVFNILFIASLFLLMRRRVSAVAALLISLIVSLSSAVSHANNVPGEVTDTASHLCAVIMMLSEAPLCATIFLFLGLLNDERMIFALPFVMMWHYPPRPNLDWLRHSARWVVGALSGLGLYFAIRYALTVGLIGSGIRQPQVYGAIGHAVASMTPFFGPWRPWCLNVIAAFRWAWLIPIAFVGLLLQRRLFFFALLFAASVLAEVLLTAMVYDISRSVGYIVPALYVAIEGLSADGRFERYLLRTCILQLLTPGFFVTQHMKCVLQTPIPKCVASLVKSLLK
jgi:hypothetical protein